MVGLAGALCGMITIRCPSDTAVKLASKMAGDEAAKDPNIVGDATRELCNMVAGNFKAKVTSLADHCMLSVPTVIYVAAREILPPFLITLPTQSQRRVY